VHSVAVHQSMVVTLSFFVLHSLKPSNKYPRNFIPLRFECELNGPLHVDFDHLGFKEGYVNIRNYKIFI